MTSVRSIWIIFVLCAAMSGTVSAQDDPPDHHDEQPEHHHDMPSGTWAWTTDAHVFVGYDYQQRHFADVEAWESQNWFMGSGSRALGRGRLTIGSMLSLEPFTLHDHGS